MYDVADAAMFIVNCTVGRAIETGNEAWYIDFVQLHKLLYLAQCEMMRQYGQPLFRGTILACPGGPYVNGISFVARQKGFGKIMVPFMEQEFVRPSYRRVKVVKQILDEYGRKGVQELCLLTKNTKVYSTAMARKSGEEDPEILLSYMPTPSTQK